jgi:hypothetical protein
MRLVGGLRRCLVRLSGGHARVRVVSGLLSAVLMVGIGGEVARMLASEPTDPQGVRGGLEGFTAVARDPQIQGWLEAIQKRPLFKPAIPLPARGMARESVNRVRGLLSLHGILDRGGELTAYINVKGLGMASYKVGDRVEELFKVTRIEDRRVELEIAGERVELEL